MKHVVVLSDAADDIEAARDFYEVQEIGVGEYFVDSLLIDIERLADLSGIHPKHFNFHRMLATPDLQPSPRLRLGRLTSVRHAVTLAEAGLPAFAKPPSQRFGMPGAAAWQADLCLE